MKEESAFKIISFYKTFCQFETRYSRTFIMFLFYFQGFLFIEGYYEYELVGASNFSRNTLNTINNIVLIPNTIFALIVTPYLSQIGVGKSMLISFCIRYFLWVVVYFIFPTSTFAVWIIIFIQQFS